MKIQTLMMAAGDLFNDDGVICDLRMFEDSFSDPELVDELPFVYYFLRQCRRVEIDVLKVFVFRKISERNTTGVDLEKVENLRRRLKMMKNVKVDRWCDVKVV